MNQPFELVVQDHGLAVLRVCRALLDEHRAQDAWSETFLAALRAYPQLDPQANVRAWLLRIAHNKSIDELRRLGRENILPDPAGGQIDQQPGPEAAWLAAELWEKVRQLPEKQRLVLAYRYLGGLDYRQIADILTGSPEAARRAASDGIGALRRQLVREAAKGEQT